MLANYAVLLTAVSSSPPPLTNIKPRSIPVQSSATTPPQRSPASEAAHGVEGTAAMAAACQGQADVRDALVDRDVTESIVCRRRYRILPNFEPGDRPYVVRDPSWHNPRRCAAVSRCRPNLRLSVNDIQVVGTSAFITWFAVTAQIAPIILQRVHGTAVGNTLLMGLTDANCSMRCRRGVLTCTRSQSLPE